MQARIYNPFSEKDWNEALKIHNGKELVDFFTPFYLSELRIVSPSMLLINGIEKGLQAFGTQSSPIKLLSVSNDAIHVPPSFKETLDDIIVKRYARNLLPELGETRVNLLIRCIWKIFCNTLKEKIARNFPKRSFEPLIQALWVNLRVLLFYQAGLLIVGNKKEVELLNIFSDAFLKGIFPLGYINGKNLNFVIFVK